MNEDQRHPEGRETNISAPPGITSVTLTPLSEPRTSPANSEVKARPNSEASMAVTIKFAAESHDYVREYIRNADQKAVFYFSICAALLAFEHTQNWAQRWMKLPSAWSAADLLAFVAMAGLAVAAAFFLITVIPRMGGSPRGLIFFKAIAAYSNADEYVSDIVKRTESELAAEKLRHCYELAKVASSKYNVLSMGLRIGAAAILCSLFLLVGISPADGGKEPRNIPSTVPPLS